MKFTREERIINALILYSRDIKDIGLLHGKLGIAIYFYFLSRYKKIDLFFEIANELFDSVTESVNETNTLDFESGITGIGWGIEYLCQHNFIKVDSDEVFKEFDSIICDTLDNGNIGLELLISIGYYTCKRLENIRYNYSKDRLSRLITNIANILSYLENMSLNKEIIISSEVIDLLYKIKQLKSFDNCVNSYLKGISGEGTIKEYLLPKLERKTLFEINCVYDLKDQNTQYAGFDMKQIPEDERWGLKHGIAGYGLQKLFFDY